MIAIKYVFKMCGYKNSRFIRWKKKYIYFFPFFAAFFFGAFLTAFLAAGFFTTGFLAAFFATFFLGVAAFFAAGFFAAGFLAFFAAAFFLGAFFAAGFFAAAFFFTTFFGLVSLSLKDPEAPVPLTCLRLPALTPRLRASFRWESELSPTLKFPFIYFEMAWRDDPLLSFKLPIAAAIISPYFGCVAGFFATFFAAAFFLAGDGAGAVSLMFISKIEDAR